MNFCQNLIQNLYKNRILKKGCLSYFQASFDTFTHYKSILIRDLGFVGEKLGAIRYPPYNNANLGMFRELLKNRKIPDFDWVAYPLTFVAGAIIPVITFYATKFF